MRQEIFVTNFVICVTNFVTLVTNFLIHVTNFVIKNSFKTGKIFKQQGKTFSKKAKIILQLRRASTLWGSANVRAESARRWFRPIITARNHKYC